MKTILARLALFSVLLGSLAAGARAQTGNPPVDSTPPLPASPAANTAPPPITPITPALTSTNSAEPGQPSKPKASKPKSAAPKPANLFMGSVSAVNTNAMTVTVHGKTKDQVYAMGSQTRLARGKTPLTLGGIKVGDYIRGTFKKTGKGPETIVSATVSDKAPASAATKKPKKPAASTNSNSTATPPSTPAKQ